MIVPLLPGCATRGVGDMGVIIERATGSVEVVETTGMSVLARVEGLGDLSHASVVYGRDGRHAFVFGRDGGLSKVDLLTGQLVGRVMQAGNSIGGAISQDGRLVAVANYQPGGVRVFDAETLAQVADIPATDASGRNSKVVGLEDSTGQKFVFSLFDSDEIWVADLNEPSKPRLTKFTGIGSKPYDALISMDGRYYIAGLFGEDGFALLDLWHLDGGVKRILPDYGRGEKRSAVHKMPHLEGWGLTEEFAFLPAMGRHEVLIVDRVNWREVKRVPVAGQPVFVMVRPDGRQVWVNFAHPHNGKVQVIDVPSRKVVKTIEPGPAVMHMEFTPRGEHVWLSVRDKDQVDVYHTDTFEKLKSLPATKPSGIFFTFRAHRIGL
ncbi:MAG: protein nirF [Magnetococcales bacterium]|nr:protein nirF [Magnetococcales bacterium]